MASVVPNSEATRFKTGEEQVEVARKGGIASGKARNYKKEQIENLKALLDSEYKPGVTYRQAMNIGVLKGALDGKAENFKTVMEYLDNMTANKDTPNVEIVIVDNSITPEERATYNDYEKD